MKRQRQLQNVGTCGECKFGTWDMKFHNLDINGRPTLKRCPHYHNGQVKVIRSQRGCNKYQSL